MKVTLIKPSIGMSGNAPFTDGGRMEPLQLGVLAALTPPDVEVELVDDRIEEVPFDRPTDLVAITVETFTARRAYEISAEYRRRGVPVVLGGMHPTLLPEECARHADAVFAGDGEAGWGKVVEDAARGQLQPMYQGAIGRPQGDILPRRDLFRGKGYLPISLVQFTRGCRFRCNFCAVGAYFDRFHGARAVRDVIREIEAQERRMIFFVDDNVSCDPAALKALCRELIPLGIHWISQGSTEMTRDPELMGLLERSGCLGLVVGFESLDPKALRWMKKAPNLIGFDAYSPQVQVFRDHGLQIWAAFVLGHDFETRASIEAAVDFAIANRFPFAAFNILTPYPGTPLYAEMQAERRLLFDGGWWLHPDYRFNDAVFRPRNMVPEALTEACHAARLRFNGLVSILRRAFDPKTNLSSPYRFGLYAWNNLLVRREVRRKAGMRLGRLH